LGPSRQLANCLTSNTSGPAESMTAMLFSLGCGTSRTKEPELRLDTGTGSNATDDVTSRQLAVIF